MPVALIPSRNTGQGIGMFAIGFNKLHIREVMEGRETEQQFFFVPVGDPVENGDLQGSTIGIVPNPKGL